MMENFCLLGLTFVSSTENHGESVNKKQNSNERDNYSEIVVIAIEKAAVRGRMKLVLLQNTINQLQETIFCQLCAKFWNCTN